jgi:hypothetical protein
MIRQGLERGTSWINVRRDTSTTAFSAKTSQNNQRSYILASEPTGVQAFETYTAADYISYEQAQLLSPHHLPFLTIPSPALLQHLHSWMQQPAHDSRITLRGVVISDLHKVPTVWPLRTMHRRNGSHYVWGEFRSTVTMPVTNKSTGVTFLCLKVCESNWQSGSQRKAPRLKKQLSFGHIMQKHSVFSVRYMPKLKKQSSIKRII